MYPLAATQAVNDDDDDDEHEQALTWEVGVVYLHYFT